MKRIAITGGMGSGKSYVCHLLQTQWGVSVYDCDAAAKRLMRTSPLLRQQLSDLIGPETYLPSMGDGTDGDYTLNKAAVAQFLLASPENAHAVDAIVHPAVADDFLHSGMQWMECAILYESGFDRLVDRVIVVTAPLGLRLQRIMQRDGISEAQARQWLSRQWTQEEVRRRADYEVVNDGMQPLIPQLAPIIHENLQQ